MSSSAYVMINFSPVSTIIADVYDVSSIVVNFNVMVFLICFILFNFASVSAIEKSISKTFKTAAFFNVVGAWGRYAILITTGNFYYLIIF